MKETKYEEKGYTLENGMSISLDRPGLGGVTNMGEHLDLVARSSDGDKRARIEITCMNHGGVPVIVLRAREGASLRFSGHVVQDGHAAFKPNNLASVSLLKEGVECTTSGLITEVELRLA